MKKIQHPILVGCLSLCLGAMVSPAAALAQWQPGAGPLKTPWTDDVKPENAHLEYPRPQMARGDWLNLNGLWDLAIAPKESAKPEVFPKQILVPFPVESALSGVMRPVSETDQLWYRRSFVIPKGWVGRRVLLHFGAVDFEAAVWVNGIELGRHRGGYGAFSFDITDALHGSGSNELIVSACDPTDAGTQPRGKQVRKPNGIWYTSTSGIWQTVWLEPVEAAYITDLKITPDVDDGAVTVHAYHDPTLWGMRGGGRPCATAGKAVCTASVTRRRSNHACRSRTPGSGRRRTRTSMTWRCQPQAGQPHHGQGRELFRHAQDLPRQGRKRASPA